MRVRPGFGSSNIGFTIVDGWQLGQASVEADNTALLDKLIASKAAPPGGASQASSVCGMAAGLYRLQANGELKAEMP